MGQEVMLTMIKFKACPKCHGDLHLGEDMFGKYFNCLQCGYLRDVEAPRSEPKAAPADPADSDRKAA
jgi:ssDNA-binding Zn-finger/Zn-ribbon topoisomerase 1